MPVDLDTTVTTVTADATATPATETVETPTLDAAMSAAFDKASTPAADGEAGTARDDGRDDKGRFAAKPTDATAVEADKTEATAADPALETGAHAVVAPPQGLPPALHEDFAKAPENIQKFMADFQAKTAQAFSRYGAAVKQAEPFFQVAIRNRDLIEAAGLDPVQAIGNMFDVHRMLEDDFVGGIAYLAETYPLDPVQLITRLADQYKVDLVDLALQDRPQTDSALYQMQREMAVMRHQLNEANGNLQARDQGVEQQRANAAENQVRQAFAALAGKVGDDQVREAFDDILAYIPLIEKDHPDAPAAAIVEEAYNRAKWANPAIRERMLAEQKKTEDAERAKAEADRKGKDATQKLVAKAKQASTINVRSAPANGAAASYEDALAAAYDRAMAAH